MGTHTITGIHNRRILNDPPDADFDIFPCCNIVIVNSASFSADRTVRIRHDGTALTGRGGNLHTVPTGDTIQAEEATMLFVNNSNSHTLAIQNVAGTPLATLASGGTWVEVYFVPGLDWLLLRRS